MTVVLQCTTLCKELFTIPQKIKCIFSRLKFNAAAMSVGMNYEIYISIEAQERSNGNELILCIYSMGITNFSFSLVYRYSDDFNLNLEKSNGSGLEGLLPK
jgi:hypothetical protein